MSKAPESREYRDLKQIDIVKIYSDKSCLIIDDFPEIRGALSRTIKSFGAKSVETASNGEEAIGLCAEESFDIVLCDYNLGPGKDGQQILEEIRYLRTFLMTSLFVMITGESSREMVLGALEYQPDDYITKPYTQASLRVRLDKALIRHQSLLHIKKHISNSEHLKALEACDEMIIAGDRYAIDCLKMKGHLHVILKQFIAAEQVYGSVIDNKPIIWARLGMGKTLIEQERLGEAEQILKEIIKEDERYIEAHDLLADLYRRDKNNIAAQQSTETATRISPKSTLRHRALADLANKNNDDEIALKSHQQAIKWGQNSCHESEQDYFNYARKVSEVIKGDNSSMSKSRANQARKLIERARKRYANDPDVPVQAALVESQLQMSSARKEDADKVYKKAMQLYKRLPSPNVETSLEYARTLCAADDESAAKTVLLKLASQHEGNAEVMSKIDRITSEPISETGKEIASTLTREGIGLYETKNFEQAIQIFDEAIGIYPRHVGLHLNLLQVVIADTAENGPDERKERMCLRGIRTIGNVQSSDPQHHRYTFIMKHIQKHYPSITA